MGHCEQDLGVLVDLGLNRLSGSVGFGNQGKWARRIGNGFSEMDPG